MKFNWADPGVLWKKAHRAIRAMIGKTLQTVPFKGISTVLWVHHKLPQSTVSQAFPSNKSYESKAGCNRTPATVLWVPLINARFPLEAFIGTEKPGQPETPHDSALLSPPRDRAMFSAFWGHFLSILDRKPGEPVEKTQKNPKWRNFPGFSVACRGRTCPEFSRRQPERSLLVNQPSESTSVWEIWWESNLIFWTHRLQGPEVFGRIPEYFEGSA